jgi:hypothetical protein
LRNVSSRDNPKNRPCNLLDKLDGCTLFQYQTGYLCDYLALLLVERDVLSRCSFTFLVRYKSFSERKHPMLEIVWNLFFKSRRSKWDFLIITSVLTLSVCYRSSLKVSV